MDLDFFKQRKDRYILLKQEFVLNCENPLNIKDVHIFQSINKLYLILPKN